MSAADLRQRVCAATRDEVLARLLVELGLVELGISVDPDDHGHARRTLLNGQCRQRVLFDVGPVVGNEAAETWVLRITTYRSITHRAPPGLRANRVRAIFYLGTAEGK